MDFPYPAGPLIDRLAAEGNKNAFRFAKPHIKGLDFSFSGLKTQVLLAWEEPERMHRGLMGAKFTAKTLAGVRRRGWAQSVSEREVGVASVSAPVRGPAGRVVAAVSVSGPMERLGRAPGRLHAQAVVTAAARLTEALRRAGAQ